VIVTHGAEITMYGKLPGTRQLGRRVLRGAAAVVAAGGYPAAQAKDVAGAPLRGVVIPPGVDTTRFRPAGAEQRRATRAHFGLDPERPLVLGLSRLVPRKGFDVLIDAVVGLDGIELAIAGRGRDRRRLERRAGGRGDVHFLGPVPQHELASVYACADVFAMCCRERWGGLEAEGFGIVFLEAAAAGVAAVAGRSGGAHEAVVDGETGFVVPPREVDRVAGAIDRLCRDSSLRAGMGSAARRRACDEFADDVLVERLAPLARGDLSAVPTLS
jgi:phosphatidylinositol alpha-1,6-mannosyltransferase